MSTLAVVNLIGIVIAIAFNCWAVYRGLGLPMATLISCIIVWITGGVNIEVGYSIGMESVAGTIGNMLAVFMFGSLLGWFYVQSGAIAKLGMTFFSPFKNVQNPKTKRTCYILMFFIIRFVVGLTGVDNMAIMVTMVALATVMYKELDMPRKYVNATLMIAGTISTFTPAVPTMLNVIVPMFLPGYTAQTHTVQRLFFCLLFVVLSTLILSTLITREKEKGVGFVQPAGMQVGDLEDPTVKRPPFLLTLVPIVVIVVVYNLVGLEAWSSCAVGAVVSALLFCPYIKAPEGQKWFGWFISETNRAAIQIPLYYMLGYALATAITTSVGWELLQNWMNAMATSALGPVLSFGIISFILVPIGSSALMINATIATEIFVPAGMSVATAGTLLILANTVLDTLPNSPGMIIQADLTETPMSKCYPSIFVTTVLLTGGIYILAIIMGVIGIL